MLTNDDSWASPNIRATFYALRQAGHKGLMVAPSHQQSGTGGTFKLPTNKTLTTPGKFDTIPVGAPYAGRNQFDSAIRVSCLCTRGTFFSLIFYFEVLALILICFRSYALSTLTGKLLVLSCCPARLSRSYSPCPISSFALLQHSHCLLSLGNRPRGRLFLRRVQQRQHIRNRPDRVRP